MQVQITKCPPAPQAASLNFDKYNFAGAHMQPVSARVCRDEEGLLCWETPGVDFGSYDRMQTEHRAIASHRRFEPPSFSVNDRDLRLVIVHAVERRAWSSKRLLKRQRGLPLVERLKTAEEKCRERAGRLSKTLDGLCCEFVTLRNNRSDDKRLGQVQMLIQSIDTQLIIDRHPGEVYGYILYAYFRTGATSAQIASDLGLHAPAIRQLLSRICKIAKKELNYDLGEKLQQRKTAYEESCRAARAAARAAAAALSEARRKETRRHRREQGLCPFCGSQPVQGRVNCRECLDKIAERQRAQRAK